MAQDFVNLVGGISADEIMHPPSEQQILLVEGGMPIRAGRIRYYEDELFSGKFDQNPLTGPPIR